MSTADPYAAQAHARAQAGRVVDAMPLVPAQQAPDWPPEASPQARLWAETTAPYGYTSRRLNRGARLLLADVAGDACASMLIFNAENPAERLNVADTAKVQWNAYLSAGAVLLSDMGRVLASILTDESGRHDLFCGPSTAASNARKYGAGENHGPHPNARDRLILAVAKHGLSRRDVHPCVNFFKPVGIAPDGGVNIDVGPFAPGRTLVLRAEMDLIVAIANCPHVLDPRPDGPCGPLQIRAWRGPITQTEDPIRNSSPERLRAFLNVEDYFAR